MLFRSEIIKVHTIFGGKNPHPNYLVGGVPASININGSTAINSERLAFVAELIDNATEFVEQVYIPDLLAVASYYMDWFSIGGGLKNYLAYGDLPTNGYNDPSHFKLQRGAILNRNLSEVLEVKGDDPDQVREYVTHSWYKYKAGNKKSLPPWEGETDLNYTGPKPPYKHLNFADKYSWLKTPRWKNHPMEVGPLARMLVAYASGNDDVKEVVNEALGKLKAPVTALFSTLGRTAARGLETKLIAHWMKGFYNDLVKNIKNGETRMFNDEKWDPSTWPKEAKGVGLSEAPRGALAHWIIIKDRKIEQYQLVVPSTWNASPRDANGKRSAYESSLLNTPMADPQKPLELLRTIHSFDPCIACAVHLYDPEGKQVNKISVI